MRKLINTSLYYHPNHHFFSPSSPIVQTFFHFRRDSIFALKVL